MPKFTIEDLRALGVEPRKIVALLAKRQKKAKERDRALKGERQARYRGRRDALSTEPKKVNRKRRVGTEWPGHETVPIEWVEMINRPAAEIEYAFERFRNWAIQRNQKFIDWPAAWRNCAGKTGWAFEKRTGNGKSSGPPAPGTYAARKDAFAAALDILAERGEAGLHSAGEYPDAPVRGGGGERPPDLFDRHRNGHDPLPPGGPGKAR